jgi:hypothetical protein
MFAAAVCVSSAACAHGATTTASVVSPLRNTTAPAPTPTRAVAPTASSEVAAEVTPPPAAIGDEGERRAAAVPTACEPGTVPCATPAKFVDHVCRGKYPELALAMLAKGTPWRRGYVKVETLEPINTYDGERSDDWLAFGEEVLMLRTRGPSGAASKLQISGPTDVDVLRWDGTCATIRREMLALSPTNTTLLTARVVWKYLDTPTQDALLKNSAVQHYSQRERPACRGSTMRHPDAPCDKASRQLTDAIAVAVRSGIPLPAPAKVPAWEN